LGVGVFYLNANAHLEWRAEIKMNGG